MAQANTPSKQATQPNALATVAATLATTPSAPVAKVAQVALRGGPVVATIALSGTPYRTGAAHNALWWAAICKACATGPAAVAPLLATPANPAGVPSHFVAYTLRRGYLVANPPATTPSATAKA
jgi:hypothetical protein